MAKDGNGNPKVYYDEYKYKNMINKITSGSDRKTKNIKAAIETLKPEGAPGVDDDKKYIGEGNCSRK